jgi:predicted metalloendopeptidase
MLAEHSLEHWKTYMRWQVIHGAAPYLTKATVDENFNFFVHTPLGQAYVDRAFPPESKARTIEMVHAIERAMRDDIESVTWMTPPIRAQSPEALDVESALAVALRHGGMHECSKRQSLFVRLDHSGLVRRCAGDLRRR